MANTQKCAPASLLPAEMEGESNFQMSYEALSTYIRAKTRVFLQVCCAEERGVFSAECVGELIVNIGGLRRHLLPTASFFLPPSDRGGIALINFYIFSLKTLLDKSTRNPKNSNEMWQHSSSKR